MLDLTHEPELGYIFYPYEGLDHPGSPRMDVVIPETPTERHFDPQKVTYQIATTAGTIENLSIHHPWILGKKYRVCAGKIIVKDRKGKYVEAFSFGGDLQVLTGEERTVCGLLSSAPIFPIFGNSNLPAWFASEVEIILARQKAHWDPRHPHDFEHHLANLDPLLLYACCLQALKDRLANPHLTENKALEHHGAQFVNAEIERLKANDQWPVYLPSADQLFCSGG